MEDAAAVEDSEEASLHCSIRGYHIAILEYSYGKLNMLQCARVHTMQVDTESTP